MSLRAPVVRSPGLPQPPDGIADRSDPLFTERFGDAKEVLRPAGIYWEAWGRCSRFVERGRNRWTGQAGIELRLVKDCPRGHSQAIESWQAVGRLVKRDWIVRHDGPPIAARIIPIHMIEADTVRPWAIAISDDGCHRINFSRLAQWRSSLTTIVDFHEGKDLADMLPLLAAEHGWDRKALEIESLEQLYVPKFMRDRGAPAPPPSFSPPSI